VPKRFTELVNDDDKVKAERVMQAMLKMKKLDIAALEKAYDD
jgi:predicted 3-demethylubiquinone-9 3-methyltransferase (glyoxalase superfamily)